MQVFRIREDRLKEITNKALSRSIPIFLVAILVGGAISKYSARDKEPDNAFPFFLVFMLLAVAFGLYRGVKRQRSLLQSYQLILTKNTVIREQLNTPVINIYFTEITEIKKSSNGNLTIRGSKAADVIEIPAQIENYKELLLMLEQIKPVKSESGNILTQKSQLPLALLTLGLMACVFLATNQVAVAISGGLFVALAVWSFFKGIRNRNIDAKTKRGLWWIWIVIVSVIVVMITKLTSVPATLP